MRGQHTTKVAVAVLLVALMVLVAACSIQIGELGGDCTYVEAEFDSAGRATSLPRWVCR